MEAKDGTSTPTRLRDATLDELGKISVVEWLYACDRLAMLLGASIAVGVASGSVLFGVGAFCALRFIGLKLDQAAS